MKALFSIRPTVHRRLHWGVLTLLLMMVTALPTVHYTEVIPWLGAWHDSSALKYLQPAHTIIGLTASAAISFLYSTTLGVAAILWFLALHIPFFALDRLEHLPQVATHLVAVVAAIFVGYISTLVRRFEDETQKARRDAQTLAEERGVLHREASGLAERLMALAEVSQNIVTLDFEQAIAAIVESARKLLRARYAALGVMADGGEFSRFVQSGFPEDQVRAVGHWPRGTGMLGEVLRGARPIRLPNVRADPRFAGFPPGHPDMTGFLGVPVVFGGRTVGGLYVADKDDGTEFSAEDEEFLVFFARHAALAVSNAQLYGSVEARAEELSRSFAAEKERFENLFQSVAEGIAVVDSHCNIVLWNPAAERITGFGRESVIGRDCHRFLRYADEAGRPLCEGHRCIHMEVMGSGVPSVSRDVFLETVGGRKLALAVSLSVLPVAEGGPPEMVEVFRDVSRERELDRLKTDFVSIVSHELRTPLSSIQGFSELMLTRTVEPEKRVEWVRIINEESVRLGKLVDDLLDISRIESGRVALHPEPVDIPRLVDERLATFRPGLKKHTLVFHGEDGLPPVMADRDRIARAIDNLISNAIKYSPNGGEVQVTVLREADGVKVSVADQGIGIPPDKLDKVFERFERLESFITRKTQGVGLGLAISKASVEMHGGRIWADSTPGKGSVFHFTLPAMAEGGQ